MKYLFSLLIFISSFSLFGQNPILYSGQWELTDLIINGVSYPPPAPSIYITEIPLNFYVDPNFGDQLDTMVCGGDFGTGDITFSTTANQFTKTNFGQLAGGCNGPGFPIPDSQVYADRYFDDFWQHPNLPQTYSYQLQAITNGHSLIITNAIGNIAVYNSVVASNDDNLSSSINLYPNPVDQKLYWHSDLELEVANLSIFDISGKEILKQTIDSNYIDVSSLTAGRYFLQLEQESGEVITSSFIKE